MRHQSNYYQDTFESPFGKFSIRSTEQAIEEIKFTELDQKRPHPLIDRCKRQLEEYFNAQRIEFDLPINMNGTPFQRNVWKALCSIPFGSTVSYQSIAIQLNNHKAARAVGAANGQNPIAIIVPCHRVIGKNGTLTGYAGGVQLKQKLLNLEQSKISL